MVWWQKFLVVTYWSWGPRKEIDGQLTKNSRSGNRGLTWDTMVITASLPIPRPKWVHRPRAFWVKGHHCLLSLQLWIPPSLLQQEISGIFIHPGPPLNTNFQSTNDQYSWRKTTKTSQVHTVNLPSVADNKGILYGVKKDTGPLSDYWYWFWDSTNPWGPSHHYGLLVRVETYRF